MAKQPFVVTGEWLEALRSRYFALDKADSDVLLQWALEAMERERRLVAELTRLLDVVGEEDAQIAKTILEENHA